MRITGVVDLSANILPTVRRATDNRSTGLTESTDETRFWRITSVTGFAREMQMQHAVTVA
jgi:hypothetical protein